MPSKVKKKGRRWEVVDRRTGRHKAWARSKRRARAYAAFRDHHVSNPRGRKRGSKH